MMRDSFLFSATIIGYLFFAAFSFITPIVTMARGEKDCKHKFSAAVLFFSEIVYTIIGPVIGFMRFDQFGADIPFAKQHVLVIILLVISSSASFWFAKLTTGTTNPFIRIIVSIGMLQGIILCAVTTIHFLPFMPNGIVFPTMGFELLSPLIAFIMLLREFYFYNRTELNLTELLPYREELGFVPIPFKILQLSLFNRCLVYGAFLIPVVTVHVLFAYGCGQDIDSLVKAFTHSHGFIFSMHN